MIGIKQTLLIFNFGLPKFLVNSMKFFSFWREFNRIRQKQREVAWAEVENDLPYFLLYRPLILNFGSCTWPPFMANLIKFFALEKEFGQIANFALVYTEEAHPSESGDYINYIFDIKKAK